MQIKGNYDISIEVTTIHPYFPRTNEISRIIMDLEINLGNYYHAYIYSDSDNKPIIRVIFKEKCDAHCSILCLRQHMSIYRIKIISKIEDKSHQSENYPAYIIVLDFRTTHFDEVSLSMEIAEILQSIGEQYPSLMGIIFAIPRKTETDISVEPMYYFVSNPFLQSKNSALNKLKNINAPSSSELIQMLIPLIIYRSGMEISVTNLCVNGLRMDQLHSMGLPVVPHDFVHD